MENMIYPYKDKTISDIRWKPHLNLGKSLLWGFGAAGLTAPAVKLLTKQDGWEKAALCGLLAGIAGFTGRSIMDFMTGTPFDQYQQIMPKGKDVYIGVTGAAQGKGSNFHKSILDRYGKDNVVMFRWCDRDALQQFIRDAKAAGKRVHINGHSYGGSAAINQAVKSGVPIETVDTYDPVSWTERIYNKPKNIKKWTNWIPQSDEFTDPQLFAVIGGRWGMRPKSKQIFGTDHSSIIYRGRV